MKNAKWINWKSDSGWLPPSDVLIAGIEHNIYPDPQSGKGMLGDFNIQCSNDYLAYDLLELFERSYFSELKDLLGNPDFYRSTSMEYPNFFGREALWLGEENSVHWSLRAAIHGASSHECDSYLIVHRTCKNGVEENEWRTKISEDLRRLPEAQQVDGRNSCPKQEFEEAEQFVDDNPS
jgi:hypothetical protein